VIRLSLANKAASGTIASSNTFSDAACPATNALDPTRPFRRAKTTGLGPQRLTVDFGSAQALDVVALIHVNVVSASVQGHTDDVSWGAPAYNQAITIGPAPNDRYQHGHRIVGAFNYRYLSISIPNQTPTDGDSIYAIGGIFAGVLSSPPRDILMDPQEDTADGFEDVGPDYPGAWSQRLMLGNPQWRVSARRLAETEAELAAWRTWDRQWLTTGSALVLLRDAYPAEAAVMKRMDTPRRWIHARFWSQSSIDLCEVTG
jgi:hypothetical protein